MSMPRPWTVRSDGESYESGQSWVFEVCRSGDDASYALKRLKNSQRHGRFEREIRTMLELHAAGLGFIPPVIDSGMEKDKPYYVIPWYPLGSLADLIDSGRYVGQIEEGLTLLADVARRIARVHASGVAHRDIKPGNILISGAGPMIADFGLCLTTPEEMETIRLTPSHEVVGSRFYVAPENESGMNEDDDQRPADFYAFAKVIWATLAPSPRLGREALLVQLDEMSESPLARLRPILARLLDSDPQSRLNDWGAVAEELDAVRHAQQGSALPPKRPEYATVELARRFAASGPAISARARSDDDAQVQDWFMVVFRKMAEEARSLKRGYDDLEEAAGNTITITDAQGGDRDSVFRMFPTLDLDPLRNAIPTLLRTAVILMIHTNQWQHPVFQLHQYPLLTPNGLWLYSLPVLSNRGGGFVVPSFLAEKFVRVDGPHPPFLVHSVETVGTIMSECGETFRTIIHRYIGIASDGLDFFDPRSWA